MTNVENISGGLELLFDNKRTYKLDVPSTDSNDMPSTVAYLITYLCENVMKDPRKEMFLLDDHV